MFLFKVLEVLFHFTTFPVDGWVAVLTENQTISYSIEFYVELSLIETELGKMAVLATPMFVPKQF